MRPLLQAEGRSAAGAVLQRLVRQSCSDGGCDAAAIYCAAGMDSSGSLLKYSSRAVR